MVSIDGKTDLESDEEIPFSSSAATSKVEALDFEMIHLRSRADLANSWVSTHMWIRVPRSIYIVLFKAKINVLLPLGPLAILLHYITGKHGWVFFFSLVGIVPLAERIGYVTEQLAFYTGPTVGGLLNATFGNATEMIISIYALKNGMIRVVQQSLLGSILSNMLLVLGCAFFTGGIIHYQKIQVFNKSAALVNSGLLLMAVMGLMFPAVLHFTHSEIHFGKSELSLSRFSSCVMLVAYASYLFFQLRSHRNLYNPIEEEGIRDEDESDEEEAPEITHWEAIGWLAVLTVWVSVLSGYLVDAIQGASDSFNMPVAFISVILLPIVGNAAEHASAIMFAMKDKLDITLGVAIGSSTQISMFVIPFCVVVGWIMGLPMDLNFQLFETATLFITVLVVAFMLQDGTSNYFKGLMLILCYLIVAASFFVHVDPSEECATPPLRSINTMKSANVKTLDFTRQPFIEPDTHRTVKELKFTVMSPAEIMKLAEVQIYIGAYYNSGWKPIEGGLLDPRLGPASKRLICATCGGNHVECPGHFGYLALALPVYNVGYLGTVVNVLKCICKNCSGFLLKDEMRVEYLRKMRNLKDPMKKIELMKIVVKKCTALCAGNRRAECWKCGYVNGTVKKAVGMIGILHDRSKFEDVMDELRKTMAETKVSAAGLSVEAMLDPAKVFTLLKEMSDEDCEVLYLSTRPENLLITNILVPPTVIRPSVLVGGEVSNENDITVRLKQIIQSNARLTRDLFDLRLGYAPGVKRSWDELQVEVAQYINSEVRVPFTMQGGNPLNGFVQRLKGKQGRFRGNLSAKRVEYTGRSVISPDPNLKINEVGVPIEMAQILTYPERVTCHNIEKLRKCVSNGPHKYPGARSLHRDGEEFSLAITRISKNLADGLQYGDIVGRHLQDGDILLFNRQPSLHRMSFMSHRAKVMPWRTLRFNESVCNPYNADFDGDEMNIHVPQTEEARAEAALLLGVENNLCTPKNGEILVASTQDFLTSSFLITRKDTFYDRSSFSLMCSYMGSGMDPVDLPTPAVIKPVELWTGKQLFSVLVRPNANVRVYLNLTVTEKSYTSTKTEDGREIEAMCPNDGFVYFRNSVLIAGQLGKATLGNGNKNGLYSVLLRDYKPHAAAACMNRLAKLSAQWIGNHGFSIGISDVQPSGNLREEKEKIIKEGYEKCYGQIKLFNEGQLQLIPGSDAAQSLESGITSVLNNIRDQTGKLCMQKLHWRNSPLIMSQCGSKGSAINISQMVACVGQQSVGGCRAPNGFIDRSLPHFPRGVKTPAAKGFVASSFYSGLSPTEFFFHTMGGREGLVDTAVKTADTGYLSRRLTKVMEDLCVQYDKTVRNASGCILQFCYGDDGMDPAVMEGKDGAPLDLPRLFLKAKATCPAGKNEYVSPDQVSEIVRRRLSEPDMTPEAGCSAGFKTSLEEFLDEYVESFRKKHEIFMFDDDQIPAWKEKIVQNIAGVTSTQLEVFLDTCISRYHSKKIEGGTAIGIIGAQSICEPATQMTLKTFHFAGVASMNITLGVPRIKEILDAVKNIHTPIITAALECDTNEKSARVVAGRIERTSLGQIAENIQIVMTARSASIVITLDISMIQDAHLSVDANVVKESILQIRGIKLKSENIKVLDVRKLEVFPAGTDRNKLYFRLHSLKNMLPSITVRGINTVKRVVINNEKEAKTNHKKYKLFAEGRGLLEVLGTEGVDGCRTTSNDVLEVQRTLGIEAARVCIIEEIKSTMKQHGMNIDCRHMICVGDVMTYMGEVLGLTRFGAKKMEKSVIALASFEQVADHLFNGCVNGRVDAVRGVSECIIMGVPIRVGTGMFNIREGGFSGSGAHDSNVELHYGPG
ncbi:hypothetical protein ACFX13_046898 [Malus domestica]